MLVQREANLYPHRKRLNLIGWTATSGPVGSIDPSGTTTVNPGASITLTITPDTGHLVRRVVVDGDNKGSIKSYTFRNVRANHTIDAYLR